ncbi:hypothetical protein [Litorisediminicola beolgyonensis]|uniref:Sulfotransferase domain protein n=1 Tax=Litorisediminicola beolgyonensis TaxID=1173614 RepID=A0ABW3ZH18_9RHOB
MERHIVIAGQCRAGTTLFYNMMRHTLQNFTQPAREVPALSCLGLPGNYLTKRPLDIFEIPRILETNPMGKRIDLIVSLRDPRDVLTSRHKSVPDDYFCHADRHWFVAEGQPRSLTNPGFLPTHEAIARIATSGIFKQGVFLLRYEDLIADPERMQARLASDLDLEFEGRFSDFHQAAIPDALSRALNGVRPVEHRARPKWMEPEHHERIRDQFTRYPELFDILIALGYEDDHSWFDAFRAAA